MPSVGQAQVGIRHSGFRLDGSISSIVSTRSNILSPHGPAVPGSPTSFAPCADSIHFFLQLCIILLACRVIGMLGQRLLAKPQVVTTMMSSPLFEAPYGRKARESGKLGKLDTRPDAGG
jgi:hypothetical protein